MRAKSIIILVSVSFISLVFQSFNTPSENKSNDYLQDDFISLKDHPKSKGVNLKIKAPQNWEVKEGDRPNTVKKFVKGGNVYLILIKDNITFVSRKQARDIFENKELANKLIQDLLSGLQDPHVIDQSIVTIDNYPAIEFKCKGTTERLGIILPVIMKSWLVLYEDKIISLQSMSINEPGFQGYEPLFDLITNSIIFPEQYE